MPRVSKKPHQATRYRCKLGSHPEARERTIDSPEREKMNTMRKTGMDKTLKSLAFVLIAFLACTSMVIMISGAVSTSRAIITINGAATYQIIDGFGVNVNTTWWYKGAYRNTDTLKPAIDMLANDLGAAIFRAVIEDTPLSLLK